MAPGDIYLAQFPYGGTPGRKLRPVLLLTGSVGTVPEVLVAYISSVRPAVMLASDLLLDPARPERGDLLGVEHGRDRVARRQVDDGIGGDGDADQHRDADDQPPQEVAPHRSAPGLSDER